MTFGFIVIAAFIGIMSYIIFKFIDIYSIPNEKVLIIKDISYFWNIATLSIIFIFLILKKCLMYKAIITHGNILPTKLKKLNSKFLAAFVSFLLVYIL